jgi:hypothetical protein
MGKRGSSTTSPRPANPDLDDIDALFADIDNLDNDTLSARETRTSAKNSASTSRPKSGRPSAVTHVLLSDDEEDGHVPTVGFGGMADPGKDSDGEEGKKKRRKLAKLDENRCAFIILAFARVRIMRKLDLGLHCIAPYY